MKRFNFATFATLALVLAPAAGWADPGSLSVALSPWTGADLPGAPKTIKYRLAVAGSPGSPVDLATVGLPHGWVASFCTDRLCAPFKVHVVLPASGTKEMEFALIPDDPGAKEPRVTIDASSGALTAHASNLVVLP